MGAAVVVHAYTHAHTRTHTFNGPFSGTSWVSQYQKGETNLDFTEARDSEWQWHQLGHMQVCTSLQTDTHASTPPLVFYRPDALPAAQPTQHQTTVKRAVVVVAQYLLILLIRENAFSALTLLVGRQEGHPACKN